MNVGLIGAGRIGKIHAENISVHMPRVTITRIADIAADKVKDWAKSLGITRVGTDAQEVLADPEIGAVIICSSTDTHAELVSAAAARGKHIFCEKPVDLTVPRVKKALADVKKAGVKLQVGFNRRFDHNFRRIRDLVQQGAVGEPHIVRITSRDPAPPPPEYVKVSGGIFLDMTIHDFDMARYLTGSDAVEVYAKGAVLVDPSIGKAGDVDTAVVTLTFANGCIGVIDNSRRASYGYDQRVEVFGSKGALACGNDTPSSVQLSNESGVSGDKPLYFFLERYRQAFIDEMRAFFDTVLDGKPSPVGDIDGLKPLLMGFAAKKSVAEGRPVKISEVDA
jgi:myo-inositol 2-dehydrogenase / D-chiro-inositol 1-dehydrogenase